MLNVMEMCYYAHTNSVMGIHSISKLFRSTELSTRGSHITLFKEVTLYMFQSSVKVHSGFLFNVVLVNMIVILYVY